MSGSQYPSHGERRRKQKEAIQRRESILDSIEQILKLNKFKQLSDRDALTQIENEMQWRRR